MKEKDIGSMLSALEREAQLLVLTHPESADGRSMDPERVYEEYDPQATGGRGALVMSTVDDAVGAAVAAMEKDDGVVLVTGSLYTGAGALRWLRDRRWI